MKTFERTRGMALSAVLLALAACGSSDDEEIASLSDDDYAIDAGFAATEFPPDFPEQLIPPSYDKGEYMDLRHINGTRAAVFESDGAVDTSIAHYVELLGEPTIDVNAGEDQRSAQWHETPYSPWLVGVLGDSGETFVTVSTIPTN